MTAPDKSLIDFRVAEFAWRLKNWVRPLGLRALNLPCQLMGTGMAFPWYVVRSIDLASGSTVEDLKLGLELTLAGKPPMFCPFPGVASEFPLTPKGVHNQRLRWEQGHIGAVVKMAPRLIFLAIIRADLDLLALALDTAVPPLTMLGALVFVISMVAGVAALLGLSSTAILISLVSYGELIGGVFLAWLKYGQDLIRPDSLLSMFFYLSAKLPLYLKIVSGNSQWTRTDRRKV